MGGDQELELHAIDHHETNGTEDIDVRNHGVRTLDGSWNYKHWLKLAAYTFFILCGQSVAMLLGRLYFEKGGSSKWVSTLVQPVGFPVLFPLYFYTLIRKDSTSEDESFNRKPPSLLPFVLVYVSLGLILAALCYTYAVGLQYLPVSTVTLLTASQLGFNAFFAYFLNSQKFTPFIINSLLLLTVSSVLLVFESDSANPAGVSKRQYVTGFICTLIAAALNGLMLSVQQLAYQKILKKQTFKVVVQMIICSCLVATAAISVGFFTSGDWKHVKREMDDYQLGKVGYVMTLVWTAIGWQVFNVGAVGLVFQVSSLFCMSIVVLGLPIVPVLAVFIFHEKFGGIKTISMVLAIWGFISYIYQHYLDDRKAKVQNRRGGEVSEA